METEKEVKVIKVYLSCSDCEIIMKMQSREVDWIYRSNGWVYKCPRCNGTVISEKEYPYVKYVPK